MIISVVMVAMCALLVGWPSLAWADDGPCDGFPAGSLSKMECERNANAQQPRSVPQAPPTQFGYPTPPVGYLTPPVIQECGRRGENYSDQRWVACVEEYNRRIEQERQQRLQAEREMMQRQQQEAERRWRIEQEERRTRAMEEAAQAQRDANRPRVCEWVWATPGPGEYGWVWQCHY
jgi:hypothetical protein